MANSRRRINYSDKIIRSGGRALENPYAVKEEIANYFQELYTNDLVLRLNIDGLAFSLDIVRSQNLDGERV